MKLGASEVFAGSVITPLSNVCITVPAAFSSDTISSYWQTHDGIAQIQSLTEIVGCATSCAAV